MEVKTIYLDNSATTKPLKEVMQAFMVVNEQYYANPASIHAMGVEANNLLMRAREQVADILQTEAKKMCYLHQVVLNPIIQQFWVWLTAIHIKASIL